MMPAEHLTKPHNIADLAARLIELGYSPVPIEAGNKGPTLSGWQNLRLTVEDVPSYFAAASLVGILHRTVACFDIDVYDPDLAAEIADEGLRRFPGALERIGEAPKTMLVMRIEEPGWRIHQTQKATRGDLTGQVDVRTVTRQFVAYGLHPATGQPYRWTRGELWATPRADLPLLERDAAEDYRDWCADRLKQWGDKPAATVIDIGDFRSPASGIATDERPTEAHFLEALSHVPADLGHDAGWLAGLMAIHDFFGGSPRGLEAAKQWSSADSRYNPREVETKWRSFEAGKGVSYRSIFHLAKQGGADLSDMARRHRPEGTPRAEGAKAEPAFDHPPNAEAKPDAPAGWRIQSAAEFIADFVAPEYLIDGVVQRGRLYTLTAPTGSGKTAVMLYASVALATGGQFCGLDVEQGDVLFLAGENPDDVRARFIATLEFYGIDPRKCRLHFIAGTFSIRADMEALKAEAAKLPNLCLVVVDTFAAYFDGDDENSNAQALDFARVVRGLTNSASKPAVIMPAHPVKNASKTNLAPKGGSSLVNEVDGNLTLWSEDGIITMHWQVKHRGPDFPPIRLELERKECPRLTDKNGKIIPTVLAKPVLQMRATQLVRERLSVEDKFLLSLHDAPEMSQRERCRALGIMRRDGEPDTAKIGRIIKGLAKQKLIRPFRTKWELTKDGERAVTEIMGGQTPPAETDGE